MVLFAGFVDGMVVTGEMLRRAFGAASGAGTGVSNSTSLKVTALAVPGAGVQVAPGGGQIESPYAADERQVYTVGNTTTTAVSVPQNQSDSAVTWQVFVRVYDPQYPGDPQKEPEFLVQSATPVGRPYMWLATIVLPANTAAVQQSHIIDRRQLVAARSDRKPYVYNPTGQHTLMQRESFLAWPGGASWNVTIPKWATTAIIRAEIANARMDAVASTATQKVASGAFRAVLGSLQCEPGWYSEESIPTTKRFHMVALDEVAIPLSMRGTTQVLQTQAYADTSATGFAITDAVSAAMIDIDFREGLT